MFECTVEALKMNLNVRGFLQIGDDTLLNPWRLEDMPRDKIWLHSGIASLDTSDSQEKLNQKWVWWKDGKIHLQNLLKEIITEAKYHLDDDLEARFLENFKNSSKNFTRFYVHGCDLMYMPTILKDDFIKLATMLIKHKVMLEIGFANIALGVQRWVDIHFVENGNLWNDRPRNKEVYRRDMLFLHPFKIKEELMENGKKGVNFFCNTYMKRP